MVCLTNVFKSVQLTRRTVPTLIGRQERIEMVENSLFMNCTCMACPSKSPIEGRWKGLRCPHCRGCCPEYTRKCTKCGRPHPAFEGALEKVKSCLQMIKKPGTKRDKHAKLEAMEAIKLMAWKENLYLVEAINCFVAFCLAIEPSKPDILAKQSDEIVKGTTFAAKALASILTVKNHALWAIPYDLVLQAKMARSASELALLAGNWIQRTKYSRLERKIVKYFSDSLNNSEEQTDADDAGTSHDSEVEYLPDMLVKVKAMQAKKIEDNVAEEKI